MRLRHAIAAAAISICLVGCETSIAWYYGHPDRKTLEIDGRVINVVPHGTNRFDAFPEGVAFIPDMVNFKLQQIRAIEQVSGCKVTSSEFIPSSFILQAIVACVAP